jgi:hypothetical protein
LPVLTPTVGHTWAETGATTRVAARDCPLKLKTKAPELTKERKAAACAGLGRMIVTSKVLKFTSITMPFDED